MPSDPEHLAEILSAIDRRIGEGGAVYLHCWGGVGRTGLVVACWLQEHGRTPGDALAELSAKWSTVEKSSWKPKSPETPEQVSWVKTWSQRRRSVQQLLLRERYRGALLGLAVGDALGTTLEFKAPGTFKPITDMVGATQQFAPVSIQCNRASYAVAAKRSFAPDASLGFFIVTISTLGAKAGQLHGETSNCFAGLVTSSRATLWEVYQFESWLLRGP